MNAAQGINPEAFINATLAANAAESAASNAFIVSVIIVGMLLIIGSMLMYILFKTSQTLKNQDEFLADIRERRIAGQIKGEK